MTRYSNAAAATIEITTLDVDEQQGTLKSVDFQRAQAPSTPKRDFTAPGV